MITVKDIAWLAGIIEGEGHIRFQGTPKITINMCDKDIIERIAKLVNRKCYTQLTSKKNPYKTIYAVYITGTSAIEWMFTIYSLMGIRRQERIKEVANLWLTQRSYPKVRNRYR